MKNIIFICALVVFFSTLASAKANQSCDDFIKVPRVHRLIDDYSKLANLKNPIWFNYRPETQVVVLTDLEDGFGHCAIILQNGSIGKAIDFGDEFSFKNGIYNFFLQQSIFGDVPQKLLELFKQQNINRALLYNVVELPEGKAEPLYIKYLNGRDNFFINVIVHEGFHLNIKFAKQFLGSAENPWPEWDKQPDRDLATHCYNAPVAKSLWEKEKIALEAAFKLLVLDSNPRLALDAARDFIRIREMRYLALRNTLVPSPSNPEGISCEEAESIMELEEGMADYVGTATALEVGAVQPFQIPGHLNNFHDWYYRSALAQMLIIRHLDPKWALDATHRISTSLTWSDGVFGEFKKFVSKL